MSHQYIPVLPRYSAYLHPPSWPRQIMKNPNLQAAVVSGYTIIAWQLKAIISTSGRPSQYLYPLLSTFGLVYVHPGENEYPSRANMCSCILNTQTPQDLARVPETWFKTPRIHTGAADSDGHSTLDLPPIKMMRGAIIKWLSLTTFIEPRLIDADCTSSYMSHHIDPPV